MSSINKSIKKIVKVSVDAEANLRHLALQERGEISGSPTESRADGAFHRRRDTDVIYEAAALLLCSYHRWIPAFVDATHNTNEEKEKQEQDKCSHICSHHSTRFWAFFFVIPFPFHITCFMRTSIKLPDSESS